jgi:hypothetical protein
MGKGMGGKGMNPIPLPPIPLPLLQIDHYTNATLTSSCVAFAGKLTN